MKLKAGFLPAFSHVTKHNYIIQTNIIRLSQFVYAFLGKERSKDTLYEFYKKT